MKKMNNKGFSLIELIIVIAIMAVLVAVIAPNLTSYLGNSKKKTDNSNADTIENVINTQLQNYCSDDKMTAVANSDDAMKNYTDVAAILSAATNFDPTTASGDFEAEFETNVKKNVPDKYYKVDGSSITMNTKQDGFKFWVLITGTKDEGFSAKVQCAKDDPFSGDR